MTKGIDYSYEVVAHELDRRLFMTESGKVVEGDFEVNDRVVIMNTPTRPMPIYRSCVDVGKIGETPDPDPSDAEIKEKAAGGPKEPRVFCNYLLILYETRFMECGDKQELEAFGCGGPYEWEAEKGDVNPKSGLVVEYTAPGNNPFCEFNDVVTCRDSAGRMAVLELVINCFTDPDPAYRIWYCTSVYMGAKPKRFCTDGFKSCAYYTLGGGYNEYDCEGNFLSNHSGNIFDLWGGACMVDCGYPNWCGHDPEDCASMMGTVVTAIHFFSLDEGCVWEVPYYPGHYDGEVEDVRTEAMKAAGCCPEELYPPTV